MLISELIAKLTEVQQAHGDVPVVMYDDWGAGSFYEDNLTPIQEVKFHKERPYYFEGNSCIPAGIAYSNAAAAVELS